MSDRHPIYALSDEFVERFAVLAPTAATMAGIAGHETAWEDFSPAGLAEREAFYRDMRRRLDALPPAAEPWPALAAAVLSDHVDERLEYFAAGEGLLDLDNLQSTFQTLRIVFDVMPTGSREELERVAGRLAGLPAALESYRLTLAEGLARGSVVARRQVLACIQQGRVHAGERSCFANLPRAFDAAGLSDAALRARIASGAEDARTALGRFSDWLERTYLPGAAATDGVGAERHARAVVRHLGMKLDPVETYAWGWSEIRRIEAAMREVAASIAPGKSVPEVTALLAEDPARAADLPDAFVQAMLERQLGALEQLEGRHFDVPAPIRRIEVKITPPGGALGAYYIPPSEDFSRPGTVWYSPGEKKRLPLWGEVTTAYHEGFPGHHLQCGMQVWLAEHLSRFQRLLAFWPGFGEGWALYAEQLMYELGYFEKPEYVLGMHAAQLMRACRVVVDIGLHLDLPIPADASFHPGERWSFELAVEMMRARAFLPADFAESEVTRYLGWPAQAIAYKVGQRVMLDLREECRRREGAGFDLKRFHSRVVGLGSVGLDRLRQEVLGSTS